MAITYPSTYPARNLTNITLNVSAVEQADLQAIIQRQHFAYGRRRMHLANQSFPYVMPSTHGGTAYQRGYWSNDTTLGTEFLRTPVADLETCDDFSANVTVQARVRMKVLSVGAPTIGATGTVRCRIYHGASSTDIDASYAWDGAGTPSALTWRSNTGTIAKQTVVGVGLFLFVSHTDVEVECTGWDVRVLPQTTIA